eukprot:Awhi_evm1s11388
MNSTTTTTTTTSTGQRVSPNLLLGTNQTQPMQQNPQLQQQNRQSGVGAANTGIAGQPLQQLP